MNVNEPAAAGVPLSSPVALSVNPPGRLPPVTLHCGLEPEPVEASCWLYAVPTVPLGSDDVVTVAADPVIVRLSALEMVAPAASFTVTVNELEPAAEGVPLRAPVASIAMPAGRLPEETCHV